MSFVSATDAINACKNFYYTDIKFKSGKPGLILTFEQDDGTEIKHIGFLKGKSNYMMSPEPIVEKKFERKSPQAVLNKQPIMRQKAATLDTLYGGNDVIKKVNTKGKSEVKQVIRDGKNIKTTLYEQYVEPFRESSKDHVAFANLTRLSTSAFVKKYKLNNCAPDMMDYATYVATEEFNTKFTEMSNTPQTDYNPEIVDKLFF